VAAISLICHYSEIAGAVKSGPRRQITLSDEEAARFLDALEDIDEDTISASVSSAV
jgi:hypothetical protein